MKAHLLRVYPSREPLPREQQLAWHLARVAAESLDLEESVAAMVVNRLIDDVAVAVAALNRRPVVNARAQALAHPRPGGATLLGCPASQPVAAEWGAWANAVAVRELDFHDTFLAADYAHPGDSIAPLLAVAQQCQRDGDALTRAIVTAYEIQIALVKSICLHRHKIDHVAHLAPAVAAGLGTLLELDTPVIYQAIQQAVHLGFSTRQSRKGGISSWKAYAPAHAGKLAVEAVDRAMRGEDAPSPIYEGEDSVIAWLLDGPEAEYTVWLPAPEEPRRAILETYTKAHSAEYQAQAMIDLAFRLRARIPDPASIAEVVIHTSHHTHTVIGSGANDPQKYDPHASRETLDHSLPYIVAVALQDGVWHHQRSYEPARAHRPDTVALWSRIRTVEDADWSARYHHPNPTRRAFGGRMTVVLTDGTRLEEELAVADAHPAGSRPFQRADYQQKFRSLAEGLVEVAEQRRFLDLAARLPTLDATGVAELGVTVPTGRLHAAEHRGIFDA